MIFVFSKLFDENPQTEQQQPSGIIRIRKKGIRERSARLCCRFSKPIAASRAAEDAAMLP